MDPSIQPFKISIPDSELDLLRRKLEVTRLPTHSFNWTEENGLSVQRLQSILDFWLNKYNWREEERAINELLPQYTTKIRTTGGDGVDLRNEDVELDVHFVYSPGAKHRAEAEVKTGRKPIPLLFIHGWPGSFLEVSKGLKQLNDAGFDVVAPSLPGYGFSSYVSDRGFDLYGHARVLDSLMRKLGYETYMTQGGDWGASIARRMGLLFPDRVKAVHVNMLSTPDITFQDPQPTLTPHEQRSQDRVHNYFLANNSAYSRLQSQRPQTLGHAMHDSPLGLLSYIADKLITWTDSYPWSATELITWSLLHYFPGPTTGFVMYHENAGPITAYMDLPFGVSSFKNEIIMAPRAWAEKVADLRMYNEHGEGGHFAMWEKPKLLVADITEFADKVWK